MLSQDFNPAETLKINTNLYINLPGTGHLTSRKTVFGDIFQGCIQTICCVPCNVIRDQHKNQISLTPDDSEEEEETVSHWLQCPATNRTREKIFGRDDVSLDTLNKDPTSTLAFAEATLLKR